MLSICIPVYNRDVCELVEELHRQACSLQIDFELLLIDDDSQLPIKELNRGLGGLTNVRYKELLHNIGRSAIRNLLAHEAHYPYLLFIDCVALVTNPDFMSSYLPYCQKAVVCSGGRRYEDECPPPYKLKWYVGRKRDARANFTSFNFLIERQIVLDNPFDERLAKYGHEDSLFAFELMNKGFKLTKIDNTLLYQGYDLANIYIDKTEQSIQNLILIEQQIRDPKAFIQFVRLFRVYQQIRPLRALISILFKCFRRPLKSNLQGRNPSLLLFDCYKLGYMSFIDVKKTVN